MTMTDGTHEDEASTVLADPVDVLVILQNSVNTLREMKDVQCNDGNWNYDPYMYGMANGMIFALSLFDDKPPEYLEAPEVWLKDLPDTESKTATI
jgi:hypothetical protein